MEYSINDLKKFSMYQLRNKVFESNVECNWTKTSGYSRGSRSSIIPGQKHEFKYFTVNLCVVDEHSLQQSQIDPESFSITDQPFVVQIQDISGEMLYTEARAKSRYTTMM